MLNYVLKRLAVTGVVVFGVSLLVFLMIQLTPGDPVLIMLGPSATPEMVDALRRDLGLDLPLPVQYWRLISRAVRGDLGRSIASGQPVASQISAALPATMELSLVALSLAVVLGIGAGVVSATRQYSLLDGFVRLVSLAGIGMPTFWLGLALVMFFSLRLNLLPAAGRLPVFIDVPIVSGFYLVDTLLARDVAAFGAAVRHIILPAVTLAAVPMATLARMTRSGMLEVLRQDYIVTARAKGLPGSLVIAKHALRNCLIPIVTVLGLQLGTMLGGAALAETIFAWPGMGRLMVTAIRARDIPTVQGCVLVVAVCFSVINLVVDVAYACINPRIRVQGQGRGARGT